MKPLSRVSIWPGPATAHVLQLTAPKGTKQPGDPLVQKGIQKPGRLGPGQHGAAPGILPQELRAPKHRDAGGNHGGEKLIFFLIL